ncbi:MAG: thioredoxin domain-containing protein [Anaerolineales bacterium]|nr:thioredoxin domain-containing protein [Anaerolineales bacterium]
MKLTEFQETISSANNPTVVDFWAPWCKPCMATKPVLEKLAQEYVGQVIFMPVNADESREILEHFRVLGIPTLMTFVNGEVVSRVTGAQSETAYRSMFAGWAAGEDVKVPMAPFDRMLRLGAGALLVAVGISTHSWIATVAGGLLSFLGIYDRCPAWAALTGLLKKEA